MPVIAAVWSSVREGSEHDARVTNVLDNLAEFYEHIAHPAHILPQRVVLGIQSCLELVFLNYRKLHADALEADVKLWHEVPFFACSI